MFERTDQTEPEEAPKMNVAAAATAYVLFYLVILTFVYAQQATGCHDRHCLLC